MPGARGYRDYSKESTHARTHARTHDFYSRVAMHQKNEQVSETNEWVF